MRVVRSGSLVTTAPSTTSLCPAMSFVAEWTTRSAPSSSGRCSSGDANVLSTALSAPAARAAAVSRSMSAISSAGFVGDSSHTIAAPGIAASTASASAMSTRRTSKRPAPASVSSSASVPW